MNAVPQLALASILPLADASSANGGSVSLSTGLLVIAVGGLLVLARLIADLRARVTALEEARKQTSAPAPALAAPPAPQLHPPALSAPQEHTACPVPPEILAVITAAVHVMLGRNTRIVGIAQPPMDDRVWSLEGRRQIFQSHTLR